MGMLREKMEADLKLRGRALNTRLCYLRCARRFAEHFGRSPFHLGEKEIKSYLVHLVEEKGASPATHYMHVASLKFLYGVTLNRPEAVKRIPFPKRPRRLPEILTGSEVERVLSCVTSIMHRTIVAVGYGAGLRINEARRLQPGDIDSTRGVIFVREGKGRKARQVMLAQRLLSMLREYWRVARPQGEWLFPSPKKLSAPVSSHAVGAALRKAARAARLRKRVSPHTLRHSFATHLLELGYGVEVIQLLLGHSSARATKRYTLIRAEFLRRVKSPLDVLGTPEGETLR